MYICILPMFLHLWEEFVLFCFPFSEGKLELRDMAPQGQDLNTSPFGLVPKTSTPSYLLGHGNGCS